MNRFIKMLLMAFISVLVFANAVNVFAQEKLKIGVANECFDVICDDENAYKKYCRMYMDYICDEMNAEAEYEYASCEEILKKLNNGDIDCMMMCPDAPNVRSIVDFTDIPVGLGNISLYTRDDNDLYFNDFKKFNNMKVGIIAGTLMDSIVKGYMQENGLTVSCVDYSDYTSLLKAFRSGKVDCVAVPHIGAITLGRLIAKCDTMDMYVTVKKGNDALRTKLNHAIKNVTTDKPFIIGRIYTAFFGSPYTSLLGLTRDEHDALKNFPILRLGVKEGNYPISFFDNDGNYCGIYADLIKTLQYTTSLDFEIYPYSDDEQAQEMIKKGAIDGFINAPAALDPYVRKTEPVMNFQLTPVTTVGKTIIPTTSLKVAVYDVDSAAIPYLEKQYSYWTFIQCESNKDALIKVKNDEVDMALVNSIILQTRINLNRYGNLTVANNLSVSRPVTISILNDIAGDGLMGLLNKSIIQFNSTEEIDNIINKYIISSTYNLNISDWLYLHITQIVVLICLLLILVVILVSIRGVRFRKIAATDAMTGLMSSKHFESVCSKLIAGNNAGYLMLAVDVDNFRLINDSFGRDTGNSVILDIASKLKRFFPGEHICHTSGDNFFLLCKDTGMEINNSIDDFAEYFRMYNTHSSINVPIKIGIYEIAPHSGKELTLMSAMARALSAKKKIKGVHHSFTSRYDAEMAAEESVRLAIESEMEHALYDGQFVVYYQPKYNVKGTKIIGAEALVRWNHPERGLIPPFKFIPIFEENGFIVDLDFYVYEQVLKLIKRRMNESKPIVPISVNISRYHLHNMKFLDRIDNLVNDYEVPKKNLELEITESVFGDSDSMAGALMVALKNSGFTISMDDFGSGYSSLNLLREMPIDVLKIDKGFLADTDTSSRSKIIVEEIISMAQKIDIKTICEGVETETQRQFLDTAGCNMIQGYLFARPMPSDDFEALLDKQGYK